MAKYAFAFVITKLTSSYIDTIIQSVRRLRTRTKAWIVVLAPNDTSEVPHSALAALKQRMALADRKTIVYVHAWPVAPKNSGLLADKALQPWFARLTEELPNCCAWREYFKLIAWKMNGFERVLLLDLDVHVLQSIDHLFSCPQALKALYAAGPSGPWQGGFFMVTPSLGVYHEMLNKLHNAQYSPQRFWFNSIDQLPKQFHTAKRCYGCEGPQGFLYWFFVLRQNRLQAYELDSCVYDAISPTPSCEPFWKQSGEAYRLKVIHKYSTKAVGVSKCRAQAANAARHVRGIVGAHDARTLFYVVQCQLGQKRQGGANKGREAPSGVSVEVLCQQYGHCR